MSKSPNINLSLTPRSEGSKKFIDFRTELAGDSEESNMMIIDNEIAAIKKRCDGYDGVHEAPFTWGMLKSGFSTKGG